MPTLGDYWREALEGRRNVEIRREESLAAANRLHEAELQERATADSLRDAIRRRPKPDRMILIAGVDGEPIVLIPDGSDDGYRVEPLDTESLTID